jgi:hypothetical protein
LHRKSPTLYLMNTTPQAGAGVSADRQFGLAGRMRRRPVRGSGSGFAGCGNTVIDQEISGTQACGGRVAAPRGPCLC